MQAPVEDLFCDTCQRNQVLFTHLLSEYLPDEEDPQYEKYLAAYDDYKVELEDRYPQVCSKCLPRVQEQIRNAGYAAKADHLRRIMDKSERRRTTAQTSRQAWTLRVISLAKWIYILSTLVGLLWHMLALIMAPDEHWMGATFSWDICLSQVFLAHSVDEGCILSAHVGRLLQYAIAADLLTIWWNPKLRVKTNSLTGRMEGLASLWFVRIAVVALRFTSLYYWQRATIDQNTLKYFRWTHISMLGVLSLSSILTWTTVRIVYTSPSSFRKSTAEDLLSAPNSPQKRPRSSYQPAHPQADVFDGMAHSFASGIQVDESSALPPSPTLTESSYTTHQTEATTPFARRSAFINDDDMDWTPTKRHFAKQAPEVLPNQWSQRSSSHPPPSPLQPARLESHSIFAQPDPNPFRHKVPQAPKIPAHAKANPWKAGVWDPPNRETMPNFFKEEQKAQGGVGEAKGLDGLGVPRNVKRDAELFASPKLKYDYYGTMKDTGLEDTFNGLFSK